MIKKLSILLLLVVVIFIVLRFVLFSPFVVHGDSMEPTFSSGSVVVVSKIGEKIKRDSIVVIKNGENDFIIRRVIGMPKEEIEIEDGVVYLEGVARDESLYTEGSLPLDEAYGFALKENEYLVLSDNRDSVDLRILSPIQKESIVGVYSPGPSNWYKKIFNR